MKNFSKCRFVSGLDFRLVRFIKNFSGEVIDSLRLPSSRLQKKLLALKNSIQLSKTLVVLNFVFCNWESL
jgi:hypothetical protein